MESDRSFIAPLDQIQLPASLDGSSGVYRLQGDCEMKNDVEALKVWLSTFQSAHTRRSYQTTVEQLLCWSTESLRKPLSSLELHDLQSYELFLHNVAPAHKWIAVKGTKRDSDRWRPFSKASLTLRSRASIWSALHVMFSWLRDVGYADLRLPPRSRSAWACYGPLQIQQPPAGTVGTLLAGDMAWVSCALSRQKGGRRGIRSLIFHLRYFACLDCTEIARARLSDLSELGAKHWVLRVTSEDGVVKEVLLLPPVLKSILDTHSTGSDELIEVTPDSHISLLKSRPQAIVELTESSLGWHCAQLIKDAAEEARLVGDLESSARIAMLKGPSWRYAIANHVYGIKSRNLAWQTLGATLLPESSRLLRNQQARRSLTPEIADEAVDAFEFLWTRENDHAAKARED